MSASRPFQPARILEITSYPPPRAGWGVRVEFLKQHLEAAGHECVVLNIGKSRNIPSPEYETVGGAADYVRKVWRFCRAGFTTHVHINGSTAKGLVLTIAAQMLNLLCGRRCVLTFHAGVKQVYFPRSQSPVLWPVFWLMFMLPRTIICNNEAVKAKIREYGIPGRKIRPIPAFSRQYLEAEADALDERLEAFYERFEFIVFTYVRVRDGFYLETLIDGFARLAAKRSDVGLVICGVAGDINPVLWQTVERAIEQHRLAERICIIDDLPHEHFLTALKRSSLYLRTPTSDGVASSVLEALAMGVPVVAAENGTRPAGTITYAPTDGRALADAVDRVLSNREEAIAAIPPVPVRDTLHEEATLLAAS
ncbi:MAG: glycosyltransferase [Acidobacteria bacterium]|nr:MAG: glycosyltransferase [Acidobacteriota bacterium]